MVGEKYRRLAEHLAAASKNRVALSFEEVERILGSTLPPSASVHEEWWRARTPHRSQESAWLSVGWHVEQVDLAGGTVTFVRDEG